jgi:hypothetical protein
VQSRWSLQEIPDREPTVGGTTWLTHRAPPSTVAMMAAPLGAPALPSVEPTAQHSFASRQSTLATELTSAGRAAGVNEPSHREPAPKPEEVVTLPDGVVVEQADAVIAVSATTTTRRNEDRRDR